MLRTTITIDITALGDALLDVARAAIQRIVDAPAGEVEAVLRRELARLEQGDALERAVARGMRVTIGHTADLE